MQRTLLLVFWVICGGFAGAQPAPLTQTDIFVAGAEGYHTFRIPSVVVTKKGAVLAFCEGRKNSRSDTGDIDVVLKRSLDNGATWQRLQVVADFAADTI